MSSVLLLSSQAKGFQPPRSVSIHSVSDHRVTQGTDRKYPFFCTSPESVSTTFALSSSHPAIEDSQVSLNVSDWYVQFRSRQGCGNGGIRIPVHHHRVGLFIEKNRFHVL